MMRKLDPLLTCVVVFVVMILMLRLAMEIFSG